MMPNTALEWVTISVSLLALWGWVHTRLNSTATANSKRIDELQVGQDDLKQRLQTVEGEMRHLPDKDGLHRLELSIADLKNDMTRIAGAAERAAKGFDRVEGYMMEKANK